MTEITTKHESPSRPPARPLGAWLEEGTVYRFEESDRFEESGRLFTRLPRSKHTIMFLDTFVTAALSNYRDLRVRPVERLELRYVLEEDTGPG